MEPITTLLERLSEALPRALQGDPISVKAARTTGRRLRVVLPLSSGQLPKRLRERLLRETRTLARGLGSVRDLDAQMELLSEAEATATDPEKPAFSFAQKLLKRQRQQALKRVRRQGIARDWLTCATKARVLLAATAVIEEPAALVEVRDAAEKALAFDSLIRDPKNITELHALRIAIKRLRFTLSRRAETTKSLKKLVAALQTTLGEIHDRDILGVWLRGLEQTKKRRQRPTRSQRESLATLRHRLHTERTTHYDAFCLQWDAALPALQTLVLMPGAPGSDVMG
jgi:CHAD domain-containing protein